MRDCVDSDDYHAASFAPSAPITIIRYPGPGGGHLLSIPIISRLSVVMVGQAGLEPAMLESA